MSRENESAPVPPGDKPAEETPWLCQGVERGVWTEPMLALLARGEEGTKWFSLIDKVWHQRTLGLAWAKVLANAGSCGVDGITVGQFSKDSARRLLDLEEQLKESRYQPKPAKRVWIPKPGSAELRPLGIASLRSPLRARPWGLSFSLRSDADGHGPRGAGSPQDGH